MTYSDLVRRQRLINLTFCWAWGIITARQYVDGMRAWVEGGKDDRS